MTYKAPTNSKQNIVVNTPSTICICLCAKSYKLAASNCPLCLLDNVTVTSAVIDGNASALMCHCSSSTLL